MERDSFVCSARLGILEKVQARGMVDVPAELGLIAQDQQTQGPRSTRSLRSFAQGRLSTPRMIPLRRTIHSARDDSAEGVSRVRKYDSIV